MTYLAVNEARKNLYKLVDQVAESHEPQVIKGKRHSAVLVSTEDWEDIQETLLVASNKNLSESILKELSSSFEDCSKNLEN